MIYINYYTNYDYPSVNEVASKVSGLGNQDDKTASLRVLEIKYEVYFVWRKQGKKNQGTVIIISCIMKFPIML